VNPGRTEDEKIRWAEGLRALIGDLRSQGIKDTDFVAAKLAQYRRDFFGDPSRVLNL
jgi:hypothetical protein